MKILLVLFTCLACVFFYSCDNKPHQKTLVEYLECQYPRNACEDDAAFIKRKLEDFQNVLQQPREAGENDEQYMLRVIGRVQAWTNWEKGQITHLISSRLKPGRDDFFMEN